MGAGEAQVPETPIRFAPKRVYEWVNQPDLGSWVGGEKEHPGGHGSRKMLNIGYQFVKYLLNQRGLAWKMLAG